MQMLFILCEANVDGRVIELLHSVNVPGYTRFTGAVGFGASGRREGTPVWPGLNSLILVYASEVEVQAVRDALRRLEEERQGRVVLKVFAVPAEKVL